MKGAAGDVREGATISAEKLVFSALSAWETGGAIDISARNLAAAAGVPVSAIHYHFGGLGHLLDVAQGEAIASARRWCEHQWAAIGETPMSPAMLGPLLACLIDDWCETQRRLAFAWREGQLMALRDPGCAARAGQWEQLWQDFFDRLCARMRIEEFATLTAWFFDGASALHLLRWRRPLDRSALEELCAGWAAWIGGDLAPPGLWFIAGQADAETLGAPPEMPDPVADAIADAAAETVAESGVAALTHRAVAARAGATLGTVSYKYRTSADLLRAAFDAIYRRLLSRATIPLEDHMSMAPEEAATALAESAPSRPDMLGSDELLVAAARHPEFRTFAAQLRYLRGRTSGRLLQALVGRERPVSPVDGAVLSALLGGRGRTLNCAGRVSHGDFAPLIARLAGG